MNTRRTITREEFDELVEQELTERAHKISNLAPEELLDEINEGLRERTDEARIEIRAELYADYDVVARTRSDRTRPRPRRGRACVAAVAVALRHDFTRLATRSEPTIRGLGSSTARPATPSYDLRGLQTWPYLPHQTWGPHLI